MANLKIDIIYYKTSSDFEMEFNLSGCCRMRMFKDKVETPKGLVNTLARDVSRSKITIIVTDLFGDNSGIPTVAKAIKLPLVNFDKEKYGVSTNDDILIPETAVPLVTKTGIYGGCIIENGPQSIIIVSSVRTLRHEIMKAYIHNYVFDIGQLLAYQERMGVSPSDVPITSDLSHINKPVETDTNENAEETSEATDTTKTEAVSSEVQNNFTIISEENFLEEFDLSSESLPKNTTVKKTSKRGKGLNIALLIIVLLLLVGFGVLAYFFVYLPLLGEPSIFSDGSGNIITEFLNSLFS
ncbi:MAG: hypothetical protein IIX54_01005 [Clostridia bacterium]|nr:hypothetical protein [Clostridia bacterium]